MRCTDTPRLQPHDVQAEQAVLGAVLLDMAALSPARALLSPEDFFNGRHQRIFAAMVELADRHEPIDPVTLGDLLESRGELTSIGGRGELAEFVTAVASASNITHHSKIVLEHAKRRRLIR